METKELIALLKSRVEWARTCPNKTRDGLPAHEWERVPITLDHGAGSAIALNPAVSEGTRAFVLDRIQRAPQQKGTEYPAVWLDGILTELEG